MGQLPRQSGFAHLAVLILLLLGVGVGVVLVQKPNIFKSRADTALTWDGWNATYNKCQGQAGYDSRYDFSGPNGTRDNCANGYDYAGFITILYSQPQPTPTLVPQPTSILVPTIIPTAIPTTVLPTVPPIIPTSGIPQPISADIDVTYIERTPRYYRYCVNFPNGLPTLCPGTENQKRWPDVGENITYRAHILAKKNISATISSGNAYFNYQWVVNGNVVSSGQSSVPSNSETVLEYNTTWPSSSAQIQFKITPNSSVSGDISANNSLTVNSHDLTLSIWVEKGIYDIFNNTRNMAGTYSFEDWIQTQFAKMNGRFAQAKYTNISPNSIKDRVKIDKIIVGEQMDGGSSPMASDPNLYLIDGRWQFTDGDETNQRGRNGVWQEYVNNYVNKIDYGLIHELTHQLGVVDLYRQNIKPNDGNSPNGGVHIIGLNGQQISYNSLNFPVFSNPGIMGGGDIKPYSEDGFFESHTAGGLNANLGQRRGFYGEYLFDTPDNISLKLLDGAGIPISGASVKLFQKDNDTEDVDNTPEITGSTNDQGIISLPNRFVNGVTTVTGHTLKPNPFGQINVVGTNGNMIIQVIKNNQEGYGFLTVHNLNLAYWSGSRSSALIIIKTNLPSQSITSPALPTPLPLVSTPTPTLPPVFTLPTPMPTKPPVSSTDNIPPAVYLSSPSNFSFYPLNGNINSSAYVSDNVGVKNVNFYLGNNLICSDNIAPYSCLGRISVSTRGFYTFKVQATDYANNSSAKSVTILIY